MNNIKLSFCIPTYNRIKSTEKLVTDILSCDAPNIEVVVLDNCSTDGTMSVLECIDDVRLTLYSNEENKGGLYNVVHVLNKASGDFVVFLTDKDHVNPLQIRDFIHFLTESKNLAAGYCEFNSKSKVDLEFFSAGFEAVRNVAYKGRHPTGYFFNNSLLKPIKHTERFSDFKVVDVFPMDFILAELCMSGKGAIYHPHLFTLETAEMAAKQKSYNASGKTKEAFFSPAARLKVAISYTKHITTLYLSRNEKDTLIIDMLIRQFAAATLGYKLMLSNNNLCIHYDMDSREVKVNELIKIGLDFYINYINATKLFFGNDFVKQLRFKINLFVRLLVRVVVWIGKFLFK